MWLVKPRVSFLLLALSSLASVPAGSAMASGAAAPYPHPAPLPLRKLRSTPPLVPASKSRPRELRLKPQRSVSAQSRAQSPWRQIARQAVVLCLLILLASCEILPKRDKTAAPVTVVCLESAMTGNCPAPMYLLPDGDIAGDVAAAMAIAESRARDACAAQLSALQDCVREHNRKSPRR